MEPKEKLAHYEIVTDRVTSSINAATLDVTLIAWDALAGQAGCSVCPCGSLPPPYRASAGASRWSPGHWQLSSLSGVTYYQIILEQPSTD